MCLLIDNSIGAPMVREVVERAAKNNSDGYGRLDLTTGRIFRTMDMQKAVKWAMRPGPAIHHFRWATAGTKTVENTHPFPIEHGWYLFQNGHVEGFVDNGRPDTHAIASILRHVPEEQRPVVLDHFDQKYLLANVKTGKIIRTGRGWTDVNGTWFSNDYCLVVPKQRVAVYGTLKSAEGNKKHLDEADFLNWGFTKDKHRLCIDGLPRLIKGGKDGKHVEVEVYEVTQSTLEDLDQLEGGYTRSVVPIEMQDGKTVWAWTYFADEKHDNGVYHDCYGESWLNYTQEHAGDILGMTCPDCKGDNVRTEEEGFIYCEDCHHWTTDAQEGLWFDKYDFLTDPEDGEGVDDNLTDQLPGLPSHIKIDL